MAATITPESVWAHIPPRARDSHKGSFGAVLVVAGSACYRGAASLAVEGALRTGAGIVTLASVEPVLAAVSARLPECCLCPCLAGAEGGGSVGSRSVEVDRTGGGFVGGQTASQQGRRHPGQSVPAAAPGKARIARGVDAAAAIRRGDYRPRPFQHHHGVPLPGKAAGSVFPVRRKDGSGTPREPGHFPGVRRQDQFSRRMGHRSKIRK